MTPFNKVKMLLRLEKRAAYVNFRQICVTTKCANVNMNTATTADEKEINFFKTLTDKWWDSNSVMLPLQRMNQIRVPLIRDGLINTGCVKLENVETCQPLKELNILDVGCGGGLLTEALARLGPKSIVGLDASEDLLKVAKNHACLDKNLSGNLSYTNMRIEEFCKLNQGHFDAVVASEVVEHVDNKEDFIKSCVACLKPGGSIFITTFNKTALSNVLGIWVSEYLLSLAPKGTHTYDKFISPHHLQRILEDYDCRTKLIHGTFYNPLTCNWSWSSNYSVHYALHAVKNK